MAADILRGASREALSQGESALESVLGTARPAADPSAVAEDLFAVTDLLVAQPALRKALTDPAREGADRAALVNRLLQGKISAGALSVVSGLAAARWSASRDIVDVTEQLAVGALLAAAEEAGRLDSVEDELFRFGRLVGGDVGLRDAFSQRTLGSARKAELVGALLEGKAAPETVRLAKQAATSHRGRGTEAAIGSYVDAAARRRSALIAEVTSAVPLTPAQVTRLAESLTRIYGRTVRTSTRVAPDLVGGVRVSVAGEVIDASVLSRLSTVRQRLAG